MKRIIFFYIFLTLGLTISAQKKTLSPASDINKQPATDLNADSTKTAPATKKRQVRRKLIQAADTLTLSDYMMSVERVNEKLNDIRDSAQLGFEMVHLERKIHDITGNINLISQNIKDKHAAVNIKNIYLYQSFASSLNDENAHIRGYVNMLYNRTYHAKLRLKSALNDSVFRALYVEKDLPDMIDKKLSRLEHKWARTDSTVKASIDSLNVLKVSLADNSLNLSNMLNRMDRKLDKAKPQLFGPETACLWQIQEADTLACKGKTLNVFTSEQKAIGYYVSKTYKEKEFILFIGVLLFIWLFLKRKLLKGVREENGAYSFMRLHYLNRHPVLSLITLLICLMPFFDAYAPTSYIAIEYTLLLGVVSVIFFRREKRMFLTYWFAFVILFITDTLTYLLVEPTFLARLWMLVVHMAIIGFGYSFYRKIDKEQPYDNCVKPAVFIGLILSMLAVVSNLFGRFSLSGILGLSGIFAITQALVLPVFIDTVMEIVLLQLLSSRLRKNVNHPFDCSIVRNKIVKPLMFITLLLWFIMLTSNLNIYHDVSNALVDSLTAVRTIGSISFKLVSVLLFFIIIWLANILQRLISFLFGEVGNDIEDLATVSKSQHSRLLITRLLVLIGGYLLAIMASGLPIDKLTIVLGALGVGIGMGLQNVVNNFVSGIILIFDGSLQIGDEIEVSGQAGKVKEIGLRASTLSTSDGAEVIIPNGSILSQNIVNWTFSNDQKRGTITFCLWGKEMDANVVNEVINTTIQKIPNVILKRQPVILYTKVTPESLSLTVHFWSVTASVEQVKSDAILQLSAAFSSKDIVFV
ncbi:mechanosensitive ion channel domain-containing protein [uncultured Bacteroides sp.]|uniref:mechanosensitive ion channel family protein n=1 Tax=uncultured Bacteroides sp. TaxID=162156 RepID=UPI002AAAE9D3|nr:mechanosensitive ion channel domain-containing protein [uncultured Bacteroides sp.]